MRNLLLTPFVALLPMAASAQRVTDVVDRGIVAVPGRTGGNHVSWRMLGEEYYDTQYNLYRDGSKIAGPLRITNYEDTGGSATSSYQVEPIIRGVTQEKTASVKAWDKQYKIVTVPNAVDRDGNDQTDNYDLNDIALADVNGDGVPEFMTKRVCGKVYDKTQSKMFHHIEVYDIKGNRLWWIDLGPNMLSGADEQWDMIGYDWDGDGKAEALMRGADNMIIHTASGKEIKIGDMTYDDRFVNGQTYTLGGPEYLLYLNGETGEPYGWDGTSEMFMPMEYPLPRFEEGETDYGTVWGSSDGGHRAQKHYFGAPYLDGKHPSIFLGRGCYTRHKMCALDVNPTTHELTQRWRWNCYDASSPWYGNGFHNFAVADVDMDGRDEIMFGSMVIDDTGNGLATTGLGHGDAQHCGDLDPYRWGLEQFTCQEGAGGNSYWNAATGDIYYRKAGGGDDGRALAGNFNPDVPGSVGRSVSSGIIGLSSDNIIEDNGDTKMTWDDLNCRIYWDGDLEDEIFDSPGVGKEATITKYGNERIYKSPKGALNNSSKNNPCALGDIMGDWREEFILRGGKNELQIYTTDFPTDYAFPTLWSDHQYRNAMVWQCMGYNQPPHPSFFLGELEGITQTPPPLMLRGRKTVANGTTVSTTDDHLLLCEQNDMTVTVAEGASPYIVTDNAPSWYKGTGDNPATASTPKQPKPDITYYTHTLGGGAFSGDTRVVKQGEGILVLPKVTETYTGNTDIWNGTLSFDGTMEKSPVWLNRHTTLISDGGKFMGGLKADYNATIYPGGKGKAGSITASELTLGFGSRIVFDKNDKINADKLVIEKKTWENGPKYKTPVIEVTENLTVGEYDLGEVKTVVGNVNDIIIEGLSGNRYYLIHDNGHLKLAVEKYRDNTNVTWNGTTTDSHWDLGITKNFLNPDGSADYAADGDDIVFNDNAALTTVNVKGAVSPKSITFDNNTKDYVIEGDSILGGGTVTKNSTGSLNIKNRNLTGNTVVNGGKVTVSALANDNGIAYGSLGNVTRSITLNDGATLAISQQVETSQPFNVAGNVTLSAPSGLTLKLTQGLKGTDAVVTKSGYGTLSMGCGNTFRELIVKEGSVNVSAENLEDQLPQTVTLAGGKVTGSNSENNEIVNTSDFIVPEGYEGTFIGSYRGKYTGTLTGNGTFYVYSGGVRCYWEGDWSEFKGTVNVLTTNRQAKPTYTPTFDFRNAYGLPEATLNVAEGVTVSNNGKDFPIGTLKGSGTLNGSGNYILGENGKSFTLSTPINAPVIKRGDGRMSMTKVGILNGTLTVDGGKVSFNDSKLATLVNGENTIIVNDGGMIFGQGLVNSLTIYAGGQLTPSGSYLSENNVGTIQSKGMLRVNDGGTVCFNLGTGKNSKLAAPYVFLDGTLKVNLLSGYTPKAGDKFTLWEASVIFSGSPTLALPQLPEGLYWDTTDLLKQTGVIAVTDKPTGIDTVKEETTDDKRCYDVQGRRTDLNAKGIKIINGRKFIQ